MVTLDQFYRKVPSKHPPPLSLVHLCDEQEALHQVLPKSFWHVFQSSKQFASILHSRCFHSVFSPCPACALLCFVCQFVAAFSPRHSPPRAQHPGCTNFLYHVVSSSSSSPQGDLINYATFPSSQTSTISGLVLIFLPKLPTLQHIPKGGTTCLGFFSIRFVLRHQQQSL